MNYRLLLVAAYSLLFVTLACQQEIVDPGQRITGRYAIDYGTGATDKYIVFQEGVYSLYESADLRPFTDNKVWRTTKDDFKLKKEGPYSIIDGVLFLWDVKYGKIELAEGKLRLNDETYLELKGFEEAPCTIIKPSSPKLELTYNMEEVKFPVEVQNELPYWKLQARTTATWITDLWVGEDNIVNFKTTSTNVDRKGVITLKYTYADTYNLEVSQNPSTFIIPKAERLNVDYVSETYSIGYSIQKPIASSRLQAEASVNWINDIQVSSTKISFRLSENNSGSDRIAKLTLSYEGARDVVIPITQKWSAPSFVLSPSSSAIDWLGGQYHFDFVVSNPRTEIPVTGNIQVNWITDVVISGNTVSYNVMENRDGGSRTGIIHLRLGTLAEADFTVIQN